MGDRVDGISGFLPNEGCAETQVLRDITRSDKFFSFNHAVSQSCSGILLVLPRHKSNTCMTYLQVLPLHILIGLLESRL